MKTILVSAVVALFLLMLSAPHAHTGSVQCECPSVDADGTGNSSCSASESGGHCTVDFNVFDPDIEVEAAQLLSRTSRVYGGPDILFQRFDFRGAFRGFDPRAARMLSEQGQYALIDQILVYALVAAVQNRGSRDQESVGEIHEILRREAGQVTKAFLGSGVFERNGIRVTEGCLEFRSDDLWAMYKAYWSAAAPSPQCQIRNR